MKKFKVGQMVRGLKDSGLVKRGEVYEVICISDGDVTILHPDGWDINKGVVNSYPVDKKHLGKNGWNIFESEILEIVEDECGKCSNSCRRKQGKCELYQEEDEYEVYVWSR